MSYDMQDSVIRRIFPILHLLPGYTRQHLAGDSMAGVIVAVMLVPQGMAYALLAGLPPEAGLYASIVPLVFYGLLGSSRALSVGPVAIVSLMVASSLAEIAETGTAGYAAGAVLLALLSGAILLGMGAARLGFLVNFLSHPVISGFSSAAALIIGLAQLKHLIGIDIPRSQQIIDILSAAYGKINLINLTTLALSVGTLAILLIWKGPLSTWLQQLGMSRGIAAQVSKSGPLFAVVSTTWLVWYFALNETAGVQIVADVPVGLPPLTIPSFDLELIRVLLVPALLISLVGFLESVSVAKSLASKRRQSIDPDQELVALGAANLGAAFTGGFPVTGGFSRSLVNFAAGAVTPIASIITAGLIALTTLFFTPLLHFLPKATLAAIIVVAVANLIDAKTLKLTLRYNRADAASLVATFAAVLVAGIELGIVIGALLSIALYLWRTSRPHFAVVGRVGETEHFRNVERHQVTVYPGVLAIRVDESLYFANTTQLETQILSRVAKDPSIEHCVLILSAVNFIDASALETLEIMIERLSAGGVTLHFAEIKGPVLDRLERVGFTENLAGGSIFMSTHDAIADLERRTRAPSSPAGQLMPQA